MKREQEMVVSKNTKAVDDRKRSKEAILATCEEIPEITTELFSKAKVLWLGKIVVDLKKENEELQAYVVPSTPPEQVTEHRSIIEEATMWL